ncbi:MAG: aminotransferase class I/II-fold pyridoxal phosphate-dependent enzyme [Hyphomicrobiaceae bacterium]|nr:aminotransferase class I/II-fold pyridoxal phosphate-dependent enzyme [Hyphomicrobiaceae bacterium]
MQGDDHQSPAGDVDSVRRRTASRRSNIDSFIVMDVMSRAADREATGSSVIHMEVGQPGTPAPFAAREAAKRAIDSGALGYTLALGTSPLRERIARHYDETYGVPIDPQRIVVTTGSSAGFVLAFLALFDEGEAVALPQPGYPCYRHILTSLGQRWAAIETGPETRWMPTVDRIRALADADPGLAGVLIASPANPTGTMLEPERLAEIARFCERRGLWFISDEIYHGLTYTAKAATALAASDEAIVINSFSKYFSMTGWRVGWMIVPERLVRPIERLAQNLYIAPPAVSQAAALAAFDARDELERNVDVYRANRALLLDGLARIGFDHIVPADGAFYLYVDVGHMTDDSLAFAGRLLDEAGVAVTPGIDFDPVRGRQFIRFSYARSTADMEEALRRLAAWRKADV